MRAEAGKTSIRVPSATWRPRTMRAAWARSASRPFVHEPMTTCWTGVPATAVTGLTLSTVCGQATSGGSFETAIGTTFSYSASQSLATRSRASLTCAPSRRWRTRTAWAEGPPAGHPGGADADRERAERAVGRRVGIGADDDHPRPHVAALGEDLVADAAHVAADVVELRDAVLGDERPHALLVRGGLRGLRRNPVVEDDRDLRGVPRPGREAGPLVDL